MKTSIVIFLITFSIHAFAGGSGSGSFSKVNSFAKESAFLGQALAVMYVGETERYLHLATATPSGDVKTMWLPKAFLREAPSLENAIERSVVLKTWVRQ